MMCVNFFLHISMKIFRRQITTKSDIAHLELSFEPDVVFLFVSLSYEGVEESLTEITKRYPRAIIIGGTTVGEIIGREVVDGTIALAAVHFESTKIQLYGVDLPAEADEIYATGKSFANDIDQSNLKHLFILSDVQTLSASDLLKGLSDNLKGEIGVTGGLAGRSTYIDSNFIIENGELKRNRIVALGLYGDSLQVNYNARGGWDSYGVECLVTKSSNNRILEVDGRPALDFYKSRIPSNIFNDVDNEGFKYPIKVRNEQHTNPVIRALLSVDEDEKSLIMSEEIPEGSYVRIMRGNIDRLIYGAETSAKTIIERNDNDHQLAILISCAGRRKVMGDLVSDEIVAVMDQFPEHTKSIGFYSYGEISPFYGYKTTSLHNLTMCITTFSES
ncbi:hypothetical protein D1013_12790 [Euzebyella marina]|uniref:Histidine kinase n=2 Tax=Euzebyella marina TaxID=1761453 RepID=A0A3G2L7E2_9FLAO|nr:hypothetical protein D1013_12790 [Euzebyella marina]